MENASSRIAVIGGGASGCMAAIAAAQAGCRVTIIEKNEKIGKKIYATGNGRCNLTNLFLDSSCYHTQEKQSSGGETGRKNTANTDDISRVLSLIGRFSREDLSGKAECKRWLQEKFGIQQESRWPLLCSVTRLVEQKGIELIRQVIPGLMDLGLQLIIYGQGDQQYIDYFNWARKQWPVLRLRISRLSWLLTARATTSTRRIRLSIVR
jgi:hypothetical protein